VQLAHVIDNIEFAGLYFITSAYILFIFRLIWPLILLALMSFASPSKQSKAKQIQNRGSAVQL